MYIMMHLGDMHKCIQHVKSSYEEHKDIIDAIYKLKSKADFNEYIKDLKQRALHLDHDLDVSCSLSEPVPGISYISNSPERIVPIDTHIHHHGNIYLCTFPLSRDYYSTGAVSIKITSCVKILYCIIGNTRYDCQDDNTLIINTDTDMFYSFAGLERGKLLIFYELPIEKPITFSYSYETLTLSTLVLSAFLCRMYDITNLLKVDRYYNNPEYLQKICDEDIDIDTNLFPYLSQAQETLTRGNHSLDLNVIFNKPLDMIAEEVDITKYKSESNAKLELSLRLASYIYSFRERDDIKLNIIKTICESSNNDELIAAIHKYRYGVFGNAFDSEDQFIKDIKNMFIIMFEI